MTTEKTPSSAKKKTNNYVDNQALFEDIRDNYYPLVKEWRADGRPGNPPPVTEIMARDIFLISTNFCLYRKYHHLKHLHDDLAAYAALTVMKYIHNFNPEKYNNPFAYITRMVNNAFLQYLKAESKNNKAKTVFAKLQAFDRMMSDEPDNFWADSVIDKIDQDALADEKFDRDNEEFKKRNATA